MSLGEKFFQTSCYPIGKLCPILQTMIFSLELCLISRWAWMWVSSRQRQMGLCFWACAFVFLSLCFCFSWIDCVFLYFGACCVCIVSMMSLILNFLGLCLNLNLLGLYFFFEFLNLIEIFKIWKHYY